MHILSWNVKGLCSSRLVGNKASQLKREIASAASFFVDILLLQEHKLERPFGNILSCGASTFWEPAIGNRSVGVCISVGQRWLPLFSTIVLWLLDELCMFL